MPFSKVIKAAFFNFKNLLFLEIVCFVSQRFAGFFGHNHATFRSIFQNISGKNSTPSLALVTGLAEFTSFAIECRRQRRLNPK